MDRTYIVKLFKKENYSCEDFDKLSLIVLTKKQLRVEM